MARADQHLLYASVAEFVLRRGRAFETGRLGDAERHGAQRIGRWCRAEHNGFRFGQPFWNTRRALEFDVLDQFYYVEGFVLDGSETVPRIPLCLLVKQYVLGQRSARAQNWSGYTMATAPVFDSARAYVIAPPNLVAIDPVQPKVTSPQR